VHPVPATGIIDFMMRFKTGQIIAKAAPEDVRARRSSLVTSPLSAVLLQSRG
jgi:hypothetical protein